jgi:hypothetical protein
MVLLSSCGGDKRACNLACFSRVVRRDVGLPPLARTCAGALFGSVVLELPDGAREKAEATTVNVCAAYGEVVLLVPRGARVLTDSLVLLSSALDQSGFDAPPGADEATTKPLTVHVAGVAAFSRVTVLAKQQPVAPRAGSAR